ncbi:MAG: hypothetical protein M1825_001150 [Sarcosagium campestre]|nr:MAG: hypothetical protein M1825_001150 [Sarcosagium campestre]
MSGQQQHRPGGYYSGKNPIPNIKEFVSNLDKDKKERDRLIDDEQKQQKKQGKQSNQNGVQEHQQTDRSKAGPIKTVTDPVTGKQATIQDISGDKHFMKAVENPVLSVPNANLNKPTTVQTEASQSGEEYREKQDITAPPDPVAPGSTSDVPIHGEKTNVLFHPTPSVSYENAYAGLETRATVLCISVFLAIVVLGKLFGASLLGLIPTGACVSSGIFLWMKEVVRSGREVEWSGEQKRGETAAQNLLPESAEYLNTLLGVVWGLINPDMFAAVADTLEDVMQASMPGVITGIKVTDINQGNNPLRVLSLRALPDSSVKDLTDELHKQNEKTKDPEQLKADEEGGDYYNLEVSLAYHAKPTAGNASDRAKNMHMGITFYLGVKGLVGVPLPIFVELQSLVVTARIRLQMSPEPPFLKNLTFTLMGVPQVSAGCIPMIEKGVNILNLPLISNFVNYAIGAAASMYVAPKSMSIDMGAILQGDDVTKDVQAMGVLWIRIHRAVGLSKQDKRGSEGGGSDPYINISFSKYGKPMYCTRVITDDLNPIWEETTGILVTPELIKADEQLSIELWDSDRSSADDVVGKVELSMQKMIQHPSKMYPQISRLQGLDAESSMPGELHWEVGFFGKPKLRPALRSDGKNVNLPKELRDKPEFQDDKGVINTEAEDAVANTPPDPLWPSGVCSVIVHQIVNLELENIKGSDGNRKGKEYEPAKPYGENTDEESKKLPSSYCTILYNDQLVYRTRAKAVSSKPIFNAGTERFIRDWRSAIVTVTVRDQRMRQHDPILGVVPMKLSEILQTSSQVTRWFPLDGGIGFGRIRLSVLFRSVETKLPPNMLGWDVGTFEFTSDRILALNYTKSAKLKMRTGGSVGKIPRNQAQSLPEGDGISWDIAKKDGKYAVRLPVKYRYRSPVVFEFHVAGKRAADAYAVIWLQHFVDNEEANINIPIWRTKNGARLTQNYVTEANLKSLEGFDDVTEVGRMHFRGRFKPGTDEDHEQFISDNDSRETQETWEACKAEGVRSSKVQQGMPDAVAKLHDESLTQGRDVLKEAEPEERQKWLSKDGTDWSGAFGADPAQYVDRSGSQRGKPHPKVHDPNNPSSDEDDGDDDDSSSDSDLGLQDADHHDPGRDFAKPSKQVPNDEEGSDKKINADNKKTEHRKHRGLMQWKPARNAAFTKNEAKFALRRVKNKMTGGLSGREPDVETEA